MKLEQQQPVPVQYYHQMPADRVNKLTAATVSSYSGDMLPPVCLSMILSGGQFLNNVQC